MFVTLFALDPVQEAVRQALSSLDVGDPTPESQVLDFKEEAGRRTKDGTLLPPQPRNEHAAERLADECACMANTPGGGALIVGVSDDRSLVGTDLDADWLRARLYDLLDRRLTVEVRPVRIRNARLLVLLCPAAIEPIRRRGKISWRVGARCVEIDATTWHQRRHSVLRLDWSAEPSGLPMERVREAAVGVARDFLSASPDPSAQDLSEASTPDLLRRLNAVTGDGTLTNAGALVFVGRASACIDYIRRDFAGEDSLERVRRADRSLIEQLAEVFAVVRAHNPQRHIESGLAIGQVRQVPDRAAREAIVNGVAHREWGLEAPTLVEHVGATLRVSSPGGFFGGVTPANIINHPSSSRNTALTELLAALKVAEREGIGVDRMIGDMLRVGYARPGIEQIDGPYVVTTLVGGSVDGAWMAWLRRVDDPAVTRDLRLLMSLHHLVSRGWTDVEELAPDLQLPRVEAEAVLNRVLELHIDGQSLVVEVPGVPSDMAPAVALSPGAWAAYEAERERHATGRPRPTRGAIALDYARARGRISSTELAGLVGAEPSNAGRTLRDLEASGSLRPSRSNRRGAGFFYLPTTP